jgi:hypothetical protein
LTVFSVSAVIRQYARHLQRLVAIDRLDPRMRMRRADEIAVQHARQFQIVDIIALALREAGVLDALALAAHAFEWLRVVPAWESCRSFRGLLEFTPLILSAAYWIALTMFW